MSTPLEPTPVSPEPPAGESPDTAPAVVERPCTTCGAALAEGQDWCLECGSAQPGRLGDRPGWRAALTVLGVTALLTAGAGAAAYAALESESQREATAQAPPAATPTTPTPPPATAETPTVPPPSETDTGTTGEVDPPDSEPADVPPVGVTPAPVPTPTPAPTPAPSPPTRADGATGGSGSSGSSGSAGTDSNAGSGTGTGTGSADPEPTEIELKSDFADTYDPFQRGGNAVGDPADAVDGKDSTAWEAPVGPDGQVRIGLLVSLEKAQKLGDLELKADTPGFTVETYATKSEEVPPDVLDSRWKHLDDARDVGIRETLKLDGTYRHVLLWITAQPADVKVAIPEIKLFNQED